MEETSCQGTQQRATTYYTGHLHFSRDNRRFALWGPSECAKLLKGCGLVGAARFELTTPCAQGSLVGFQGLHRFSPNPNNYNNLGNLLFARQSTQDASTDGVRAQFCHSSAQKRTNVSKASRYPMSIRHSSARTRKGRSQSAGGGTSSLGSPCVSRRSNVRRKASEQREASREPDAMSRCRSTRSRTRLLGLGRGTVKA